MIKHRNTVPVFPPTTDYQLPIQYPAYGKLLLSQRNQYVVNKVMQSICHSALDAESSIRQPVSSKMPLYQMFRGMRELDAIS
jgi:hypothetical protein